MRQVIERRDWLKRGMSVPIKVWTDEIEEAALEQLLNLSTMPFIHKHLAVMPDVHAGKGSTVGTVIATKGAIIASTIGVDIGCGMCAVRLPFKIDMIMDFLPQIRSNIECFVPVGHHSNPIITKTAETAFDDLLLNMGNLVSFPDISSKEMQKAIYQMGSLGGGNHFIEICYDEDHNTWIMLHSGSRNIGKMVADIHINSAKGIMKKYFIDLPDPDLAYFAEGTNEFMNYVHDMNWCQKYAAANRQEMMSRVIEILLSFYRTNIGLSDIKNRIRSDIPRVGPLEIINCHHNYSQLENHFGANVYVTRKGAVSARKDELGIIPSSMGNKSFIVRGLGNIDSFCSCSHGAGRKMSRTKAKATFTIEDLVSQTLGVECRKDADIIDEIPAAYKSIDEVMANQADLVSIVHTLKPVICVKG